MANLIDLKIFNPYKVKSLKRLGNSNDGGYVIHTASLEHVDCLVNYGVGYNVEFEKQFHKLTGMPVYAFDPTMKKVKYFANGFRRGEYINTLKQIIKLMLWLPKEKELKQYKINFIEEGLADKNSEDFKTYDYHLSKYNLHDKKVFLKIDIEDAEYDVLKNENFYKSFNNVVQLVIEFHYVSKRLSELAEIVNKLARTHSLIHIHGNNIGGTFSYHGKTIPEVIEAVFLHNSYMHEKVLSTESYPIKGLDLPCNNRWKDIPLDFFK
jgi:hypothetical protein